MKTVEKVKEGANFTATSIGSLNDLGEFKYLHPAGIEVPGKVFVGDALQCTGTEVSFQVMPVGQGVAFLHTHKENEELYVVLKGSGEYQVDGTIFPITEGSLVRVSPQGKRSWRNTGTEPMVMMVVQSKQGSLKNLGIVDGARVDEEVKW